MTDAEPIFRVAVIPTRDRHAMLFDAVNSLASQVDQVIIVDNYSDPRIDRDNWGMVEWWDEDLVTVLRHNEDPPNISRLWNLGLITAESMAREDGHEKWDVAVINSDVVVPHLWVQRLSAAMRATTAVLAYPDQSGYTSGSILHKVAEPVPLSQRITGYAHMMRGEAGLRYDESMAWWYSDDDMDWTARQRGGALLVPGLSVEHRDPNGSTNARVELQEQAGRDRQTFINKWGRAPH
ncbi:glycosyltransferase [Streptomyces phage Zuko]|uniref:Glycosyltransferase n=1 Tax=Streptomyces phage Zuko TaxID=2601695 RepID=A0A5J6D872_9CAUD|nr:glycosyltransferase [Streptomyces phage Zuko]QEQ93686.1 glycosyltransferase [Streptomyces phage Zuko]